ncbi:MAG: AAA family ATPase [Candidatus Dormibacteraceae bacterium]
MVLELPDPSLVLLIGPSGAGKTTFANRHFSATEVVSSDVCRALVADDEGDLSASADAFSVLHLIAKLRLGRRRTAVVDATNVQRLARLPLLELAWAAGLEAVAIVLDLPEEVCLEHNRARPNRHVPADVVRQQAAELRDALPGLAAEGFGRLWVLRSVLEVDQVEAVSRGTRATSTGSTPASRERAAE